MMSAKCSISQLDVKLVVLCIIVLLSCDRKYDDLKAMRLEPVVLVKHFPTSGTKATIDTFGSDPGRLNNVLVS